MKNLFYSVFVTLLFSLSALAQTEGINFQGVARNAAGEVLVNQQINLRLSILLGSESGTVAYSETRLATTNPQGIFAVVVGDGTSASKTGNFSSIDWGSASKFIKVEMDPNAGTNFLAMGTTRMQAVSVAFHAYGVDASKVKGVLPVGSGGTGVASISELKTSLSLDQVNNTADASKPISTATQGALNTKVDKVTGKDLSTNDYSTAEKTKLAAITGTNTGDQDLSAYATTAQVATKANAADVTTSLATKANASDVTTSLATKANTADVTTSLATKVDKVTGKELSTNDYTTAEKTKLAAITGTNTGDQVNITGNAGTATKLQSSVTINGVAFDGSANITLPAASPTGIPYTGATQAVNLGAFDLTVNGIKVGLGAGNVSSNTAIGTAALTSNTTGDSNIAVGMNALSGNITGSYSTAIGLDALKLSTGGFNTAYGAFALDKTTTGVNNTAIGPLALEYNETGTLNTAIGYDAGVSSSNKNLTNTTAIGNGAKVTASNTIQLGNASVTDVKTSGNLTVNGITLGKGGGNQGSNIAFGSTALTSNTTGGSNTAIGHRTLSNNLAGGDNTAVGANALRFNTGNFSQLKGTYNTALGSSSLNSNTEGSYNTATGANALSLNTLGNRNTAIGYNALEKNTNSFNTAIGSDALRNNTSGDNNTATGSDALKSNTTGVNNTAYGSSTLLGNTTGSGNTAIGYTALFSNLTDGNSKGDNNTAIGNGALKWNTTGSNNTASGTSALIDNTTGAQNIAIGTNALSNNTTGSNNTAIGYGANVTSGTLTNTTAIGNGASVSASHTIQLGNTAVTTIGGQVAWTAASDSRIKKNIVNSTYGLATVLKLRPVEYNLISNDLKQVGFIAQEVQKLVPEVVTGKEGDLSKGEILGITYSNLVPVLTKAIQEQQKQIEDQNAKIAAQQKQIEELIKLVKGQ
jgi:hypothetical protein